MSHKLHREKNMGKIAPALGVEAAPDLRGWTVRMAREVSGNLCHHTLPIDIVL